MQSSEHVFCGTHILGEMFGIEANLLDDVDFLTNCLKRGIKDSGATICNIQFKCFDPSGLTILALLSESHVSLHTYPEFGTLFFDAFTCGNRCEPHKISDELTKTLKPRRVQVKTLKRGG